MTNDIIINKIAIIRRCLKRISEEYGGDPESLQNQTKQDSIVLNIQRGCEACIDLAMHLVSEMALGIPQNSRDAFEFLFQHQVIDKQMTDRLKAMVGFRNIAIHDYQAINLEIVRRIIEEHLQDFEGFIQVILNR